MARQQQTTGNAGKKKAWETVKTWLFESAGSRKYAVQIQKASNGNPCVRIVEGLPQDDGTFRKFSVTVWSEDFERLFATLDEVRTYIGEHGIRTPPGHKWTGKKGGKGSAARTAAGRASSGSRRTGAAAGA
jgi:hypothetical protein